MTMRLKVVWVLAVLLALAGAGISYNLLVKHVSKSTGISWFDTTCESGDDNAGSRSCDTVMASPWGTLPPVPADVPAEKRYEPRSVLGLFSIRPRPSALFGLMYFSAMAWWYLAIGVPSQRRRFWHVLPVLLNALGVISAVFFTFIMLFGELEAWCPWCMVTHVCNVCLLVCTIVLWPRRLATGPPADVDDGEGAPSAADAVPLGEPADARSVLAQERIHPTFRLVLVTLVGALAIAGVAWRHYDHAAEVRNFGELHAAFEKLNEEMEVVRAHGKTLYAMYSQGKAYDIPLRDDDPIANAGPDRLTAVVISDFRCPHCSRFAKYTEEVIKPLLGDDLSITFKHFPADTACNKRISKNLHPQACMASAAAEAARMLGGTEAFWKAHDMMFESQSRLRDDPDFYTDLAIFLGLDPDRFIDTMNLPSVQDRLAEDIDVAIDAGLRGTPAVYIDGRAVPGIARQQDVFWQELKRRHDIKKRKQQKHEGR